MKQSFTLNQCVRLLYGETTPEESSMLQEIIDGNAMLKAEFEGMRDAHRALSAEFLSPSQPSVSKILKHSRDTALHLSC